MITFEKWHLKGRLTFFSFLIVSGIFYTGMLASMGVPQFRAT